MKLSRKDFDRAVRRALNRIPREIRARMENVVITIRKRPTEEMLRELEATPDNPPLALYEGSPLTERTVFAPPLYPDRIYIFQEPLEEICTTPAELEWEIEVSVVHEVAHFLGIDEERLAELGYE